MADKKGGINPAAVGVAGALVGAAVGAAAVALSDKKTRGKVLEKNPIRSSRIFYFGRPSNQVGFRKLHQNLDSSGAPQIHLSTTLYGNRVCKKSDENPCPY